VEEDIWESGVKEDANKESLGSCYRSQRDIQAMERKDLSLVQK